ncbi:apelin receptor-like [Patiria miniata]|uniref:G-protein coupled receptors family 1 profile domain-containing protein n=1 Tax=Patiria miniata TaxID=46514 RepID=A0A913ZKJ2_PATMI|nr:apelin receptor-like [Patiria miniata]
MDYTTIVSDIENTLNTTLDSSTRVFDVDDEFTPIQKFKTAAYCAIGLCGLLGNLLACAAFWSFQSQLNRVSLLIFTQALADLITSVLLILFGITQIWRHRSPTSPWLCRFWWTQFVLFFFTAISSFNLMLMSLERYSAVVHPLKYARCFTRRNTKIFVAILWLVAPVMQYAHPTFWTTVASGSCKAVAPLGRIVQALTGSMLYLWEFLLPVCIMGFCYISIVRALRRQERVCHTPAQPGSTGAGKMSARNRNITMTLITLFVLFVICWAPNQTTFFQFNLGGPLDYQGGWYHFTVILAFLNSCVNPFVYAFRMKQFRQRVVMMLCCGCGSRGNRRQGSQSNRTTVVQSVA